MVAIPYIFNEIESIFRNTPFYTIILEAFLLFSVVWLVLYKRSSRKKITIDEEDDIVKKYEPEPLISGVEPNHPMLQTRLVQSKIGKRILVHGTDCLNLATHNYLGLLEDKTILTDACNTLRKYGVGSCGPRGFYGTMDVHLDLEERLAKFMKMEEAVVYSYGFSTISSAIPAYSKKADVIFADEAVNFSIQKGLDASRSTVYFFQHNNIENLEKLLVEQQQRDLANPKKAEKTRRFLVVEGIYMNTGNICPLPVLINLRSKYKLRLFIDESISFGTLGKTGRGITEHFAVNCLEVDLILANMEWAFASIGGFCVGSSFIIEHQRLSGLGYCFSASLPPLLTQAAISALDKFEGSPEMFNELSKISQIMHEKFSRLSKLKLGGSAESPVKHLYIAKPESLSSAENNLLQEIVEKSISRGIVIVEARYLETLEKLPLRPSIRVTANRLLTEMDIEQAFRIIDSISNDVL